MNKVAAVMVFVVGASVPAALLAQTAAQRAACTPDAFRLCSSEIPNMYKIIDCLRAAKANLSPACRQAFEASDGRRTRSASTAGSDLAAWCAPDAAEPRQDIWTAWCDESRPAR